MSNELAHVHGFSGVMASDGAFKTAWRMAAMLSESGLVPKHFAGQQAACCVALIQAMEMNENPIVLMQNMFIVHGMPGFSAKYQIARANKSGIFKGRINWRVVDKGIRVIKGTPYRDLSVTAYATLAETGEEISFTVGLEMAELEGWISNAKYRTMPELMYRYRSAAILLRLYAPETLLGDSDVELETMPESTWAPRREGVVDARSAIGLPPQVQEDAPDLSAPAHAEPEAQPEPEPEPVATVREEPPAVAAQAQPAPTDAVPSDPEIVALQEEYDELVGKDRAHRDIKDTIRKVIGIKPFTNDERRAYVAALREAIAAAEPQS